MRIDLDIHEDYNNFKNSNKSSDFTDFNQSSNSDDFTEFYNFDELSKNVEDNMRLIENLYFSDLPSSYITNIDRRIMLYDWNLDGVYLVSFTSILKLYYTIYYIINYIILL